MNAHTVRAWAPAATPWNPVAEVIETAHDHPRDPDVVRLPTPWSRAVEELAESGTYWLGTVTPQGRPHVVPVLGVVVDGYVHFSASRGTRKAIHLGTNPWCSITTSAATMDLVVEGVATPVDNGSEVDEIARRYRDKYGWDPDVLDALLWSEGAPTAGPPPYDVYRVLPRKVLGFPADDASIVPTRWRF